MTDNNEQKAEELLQQSGEQTLVDDDSSTQQTEDDTPTLEDAIADAYESIDEGDVSSNLTLRDENLAALFHGLEDSGHLAEIGAGAADVLDRDPGDTDTRAGVLRLLVRIGLKEVDEDVIQAGKDGRRQYYDSDEF